MVIKIYDEGKAEQECFYSIDWKIDDEPNSYASTDCDDSLAIVV